MPRMLARLIPAIAVAAVIYTLYILVKYISSEDVMSKTDRTRLIFSAIVAIVSLVILLSVTVSSG